MSSSVRPSPRRCARAIGPCWAVANSAILRSGSLHPYIFRLRRPGPQTRPPECRTARPNLCVACLSMSTHRIVADLHAAQPAAADAFCTEVLGLEKVMDQGWVVTYA